MISVSPLEKKRLLNKTSDVSNALRDRLIPFEKEPEHKAELARKAWLQYLDKVQKAVSSEQREWDAVQQELDEVELDWLSYFEFLNDELLRSSIVTMFHFFERELRRFLLQHLEAPEFDRFYGENNKYNAKPIKILEDSGLLAEHQAEVKAALERSRLLCNSIKHGPGHSLNELKKQFPEKIDEAFEVIGVSKYEDVAIIDPEDFDILVRSLQQLWVSLPEDC